MLCLNRHGGTPVFIPVTLTFPEWANYGCNTSICQSSHGLNKSTARVMISGLRSEATEPFLCSTLFAAGSGCVSQIERESVCVCVKHIYTEPAAPCLWLIMCLIICAISSEASRESFKLGLSVCLEYLLMTARDLPLPLSLASQSRWTQPWHINTHIHLNTHASLLTQKQAHSLGSLQKHCKFLRIIPIRKH